MSDDDIPRLQTEPIEDGSTDATDQDRIDGIIEQTRADVNEGHVDNVRDALAQRLSDAGITVSREEFDELVSRLSV
jgi:hypothetical protein